MSLPRTLTGLLLLAASAAGPGCVWYGDHSMTRVWADRNTLDRPAFFVERLSQAPPPRERVERFRWMYGVGPGIPFVAPQPVLAASASPLPPDSGSPPPAPAAEPPEGIVPPPAPEGVEAPRPRPSVAWIFGRVRS